MKDVIPNYDLERPTAADLVDALNQILGPDATRAALTRALRELASDAVDIMDLAPTEILELANILTKQRGIVSVLARSFSIRLHTYQELAESRSEGAQ